MADPELPSASIDALRVRVRRLRRLRVACIAVPGAVFAAFGAFAVLPGLFPYYEELSFLTMVMIGCAFPAVFALTNSLQRLQQDLNRLLALGDDRDFFLLLRSFEASVYQGSTYYPVALKHGILKPFVHDVVEALGADGWVVTIGGIKQDRLDAKHLIAFRASHGNWLEFFELLAEASRAVVLFPDSSRGLVTEIELILARRYWEKTLVVMFPAGVSQLMGEPDREGLWNGYAGALRGDGVALPPHEPGGMVYLAGEDLSPRVNAPLDRRKARPFREAFELLLPFLPPGKPLRSLMDDLVRMEAGTAQRVRS